ncbi:MAG: hypothetical protein H0X37_11475 [Herpetosiphonaceae bacterium]|nr:hypothetical protein [Herpetosiphonaceae bacterium]
MNEYARDLREARQRQIMYGIFAVGMVASLVICVGLLYAMTRQTPKLVRLGPVTKFVAGQPVDVAVKELETSKLIPNRSVLSEDVIYVAKQADGSYQALLGVDPVNGCFLSWHTDQQQYRAGCTDATYDINGLNQNRLATSTSKPVDMVALPTQVQANQLFLEDRIQHRNIR